LYCFRECQNYVAMTSNEATKRGVISNSTPELEEVKNQLKILHNAMGQGVIYHNAQGDIIDVNPSARQILSLPSTTVAIPLSNFLICDHEGKLLRPENYPFSIAANSGKAVLNTNLRIENIQSGIKRWIRIDSFPFHSIDKESVSFSIFEDLTASRVSYELLKQSEAKFSNIFKLSGVGMAIFSLTGRILEVNNAFSTITGYSADELLGLTSESLTHPNDYNLEQEKFTQLNNGVVNSVRLEKRIRRKDKKLSWVIMSASMVYDSPEHPSFILAQFQNVTDKVISERKEFEFQQKFASAFYGSSIAMIICTLDGNISEVNEAACVFLGYTRAELLKLNNNEVQFPDDRKLDWQLMEDMFSGKTQGYTVEKRYLHKKDIIVHGLLTMNLIRNAEGKPVNIVAQIQDITAKVQIERSIDQERQRFEHIFKFSGIGMSLMDKKGKYIQVNKALALITGYSEEMLLTMDMRQIIHKDDHAKNTLRFRDLFEGKLERYTVEMRYVRQDLQQVHVLVTTSRIDDLQSGKKYILCQVQDINELKKEQMIRLESEERFKHIVDNAYLGIGFTKKDKVNYANPALINMLGYSSFEEFSTSSLAEFATQKATGLAKKSKSKQGISDMFVGDFQTKQGAVKTLEVQAKSITISNEPFQMTITRDLTDKIQLERKLQETQQIFEQAQRFANLGNLRWIVGTNEFYWSDGVSKIFGVSKKNSPNSFEKLVTAIHPDDRSKVVEAFKRCIDKGFPFELEFRIQVDTHKIKWVVLKGNAIRDKERNSTELYGVIREVTESKNIAEELQQSKKKYQLLAESGHELICLHSVDGHFLYASPALKTLWGYSHQDIKSLKNVDIVHPEDRPSFELLMRRAMTQKNEPISGRFRFKRKDGKYIWCEKSVEAIFEPGELLSIRTTTRSIESQIKFENQLKESNAQLERALNDLNEASQAKENFLSIMSHEIRTPLNSVIGLSNLLIKRKPREDQAEVIEMLKNSADNLMHLVNDILDFNKIRSGKVELELLKFNLAEFLHYQYSAFKLQAQDKGLEFLFQLDPRIPNELEGDTLRLNQVFTNLLANAIKFTHRGHVKLNAELSSITNNVCTVIFTIEDTGVGIPLNRQNSIFQPFQQSDPNISRRFGGTGLGLSIVKSLVNLMKGDLELHSIPDKGSVFKVTLNLGLVHSIPGSVADPKLKLLPSVSKTASPSELTVLYVEDVESNRFLVTNLLEDNNIKCLSVVSGAAALKLTSIKAFDIILMDIQMPDMDGYQTTEAIRHQKNGKNKKTPVLAFTAEPYSTSLKNKTIQHGIQYVITKPFDSDELIEKLRQYSKAGKQDSFYSFAFYEDAFNYDRTKLKKIKKAVINDFTAFAKNLKKADKTESISIIKSEVHKIRPIVKNLACHDLLHALEKFRLHETYSTKTTEVTKEVTKLLINLQAKLNELNY